jgi:hypothetical protein
VSAFILLVTLLISMPGLLYAQARPPAPPPDTRAAPNRPGWSVDSRTGCWIWNQNSKPSEVIAWSGSCSPDGRASGRGAVQWLNDGILAQYVGDMSGGKRNGKGVFTSANGERYDGEWRDDKRNGRGVATSPKGDRYEGEWRDGTSNGKGVRSWPDGDRYEGEYHDGHEHGTGVYTFANGDRYEGEWREGMQHGQGVYTWASGARYEGEWRGNKRNGTGVHTYANGDRYEGEWRDDRPHGFGHAVIGGVHNVGNWVDGCFKNGDRRGTMERPLSECP